MNPEQKKLAVIGGLLALLLGVGVFQMLPSAPPAFPETKKASDKKGEAEEKPPVPNPEVASALAPVDPFAAPAPPIVPTPTKVEPPKVEPLPAPTSQRVARRSPRRLGGNLADFAPARVDNLPPALLSAQPEGRSPQMPPPAAAQPEFAYSLTGVVEGDRPAATFRDASGGERLVQAGSSLDPETRVVGIRDGHVIVSFRGKRLRLSMGGPAADSQSGGGR